MEIRNLASIPPWEYPEEAAEVVADRLRQTDGPLEDRMIAAELAGEYTLINDELAEILLTIATNPDEDKGLRSTALISFGPAMEEADLCDWDMEDDCVISESTFEEIKEIARSLYEDETCDDDIRRAALEVSCRAPQEWHMDAVNLAYHRDDPSWLLTAVFCMRFIEGFDNEILALLEHDDPLIRFHAVSAAGENSVEGAWQHIKDILDNEEEDKDLFLAAISALASIDPQEAKPLLVDLMTDDDEEIAEVATEALAIAGFIDDLDDEFDEDLDDEDYEADFDEDY